MNYNNNFKMNLITNRLRRIIKGKFHKNKLNHLISFKFLKLLKLSVFAQHNQMINNCNLKDHLLDNQKCKKKIDNNLW